jgi:hypothetical protein
MFSTFTIADAPRPTREARGDDPRAAERLHYWAIAHMRALDGRAAPDRVGSHTIGNGPR